MNAISLLLALLAAQQTKAVNGLEMYYEVRGTGPALVLLHGGLTTIEGSFSKILPALAKTRRVIAVEQQGHGRTRDLDRPLSFARMADDTDALLGALGVESADFFGWSDGGNVALAVAMRHPARVRKLALLGASIDHQDSLGPEIFAWLATAKPEDFGDELREAYAKVAPDPGHWPVLFEKWKRLELDFVGPKPEELKAIAAPVLVLSGDRGGDRPEHAVRIYRSFPEGNARLAVLPDTTHFALLERPEWVLSMLESFLGAPAEAGPGSVTSKDGTAISFDRTGKGPAVILIGGALSDRSMNARLAALLSDRFTVLNYDRRGRGRSGDTAPYAPEREVEDLEALVDSAGGSACIYGISSGAVLALNAAAKLPSKVRKVALYEPPFIVDDTRPRVPTDFWPRIASFTASGRRGDAVALFMTEGVGIPAEFVEGMKKAPMWPGLEKVAHTLVYDGGVMGDTQAGKPLPPKRWAGATSPALVIDGGKSEPWIRNAARALGDLLPHATRRTLKGQDHMVAAEAIAPALSEFFGSN